jgi:chromosome segregation ATPase
MEVEIAKKKLVERASEIENDKSSYENSLSEAQAEFETRKAELSNLERKLREIQDLHYDQNMVFQSHKAEVEALKFLVESDNISGGGPNYRDDYYAALEKLDELRLIKESSEIEIAATENEIKSIKIKVKQKKDDLNRFTKNFNLAENKLKKLD